MVLVMATRHCCLRLILGGFKQQKAKSKTEKNVFMPKAKKKKKCFTKQLYLWHCTERPIILKLITIFLEIYLLLSGCLLYCSLLFTDLRVIDLFCLTLGEKTNKLISWKCKAIAFKHYWSFSFRQDITKRLYCTETDNSLSFDYKRHMWVFNSSGNADLLDGNRRRQGNERKSRVSCPFWNRDPAALP